MNHHGIRIIGFILVLALGQGLAVAAENFRLPDDLLQLLPADPALLVAVSSADELSREWNRMAALMDPEGDPERIDVSDMMADLVPHYEEIADTDRPVAVSMDFTPLMMGQEPYFTVFVPLKASFTGRDSLGLDTVKTVTVVKGDYAAISTAPGYTPAEVPPAFAAGLLDGVMSASIDLESVLATYGPFVEMGLAGIPVASAIPDTTASGDIVAAPGMSAEEVEALKEMIRSLMDSARRFDMSLDVEGDRLRYAINFTVLPDSPLDPGPQPDFDEALALTRLLPEGEDILQVVALDQTRQFEVFRPFYEANMKREIAQLDAEQAEKYAAWFQEYLGMVDLWAHPLASALAVSEDGMMAQVVMKTDDAAGDLERLAAMFEGLSAADIGISLEALPSVKVAGTEVRNWKVAYDESKLKGFSGTPQSPQLTGMGRMQAEQMSAFLRKVVPGVHLAAKDDLLFISADNGTAALAGMIATAGKRGKPRADAARIAKEAGPGVQQVVSGDLLAILNWVTEMMEDLDQKERDTIAGNPIPFAGALTIADAVYGFEMAMDMEAMGRLFQAARAMDLEDETPTPPQAPDGPVDNDG